MGRFTDITDKTLRRKLARQAARSILPNATETKIFVTANARALRHFIELRCNEHAEVEIRKVAAEVFRVVRRRPPTCSATTCWSPCRTAPWPPARRTRKSEDDRHGISTTDSRVRREHPAGQLQQEAGQGRGGGARAAGRR